MVSMEKLFENFAFCNCCFIIELDGSMTIKINKVRNAFNSCHRHAELGCHMDDEGRIFYYNIKRQRDVYLGHIYDANFSIDIRECDCDKNKIELVDEDTGTVYGFKSCHICTHELCS